MHMNLNKAVRGQKDYDSQSISAMIPTVSALSILYSQIFSNVYLFNKINFNINYFRMAANANSNWNGGGMGGGGGASEWVEHTTPQGRIYYYNSRTEASVWEKPESLMTPGEKHLAKCPWKSHKYDIKAPMCSI